MQPLFLVAARRPRAARFPSGIGLAANTALLLLRGVLDVALPRLRYPVVARLVFAAPPTPPTLQLVDHPSCSRRGIAIRLSDGTAVRWGTARLGAPATQWLRLFSRKNAGAGSGAEPQTGDSPGPKCWILNGPTEQGRDLRVLDRAFVRRHFHAGHVEEVLVQLDRFGKRRRIPHPQDRKSVV